MDAISPPIANAVFDRPNLVATGHEAAAKIKRQAAKQGDRRDFHQRACQQSHRVLERYGELVLIAIRVGKML
jgi:hypothetical protein